MVILHLILYSSLNTKLWIDLFIRSWISLYLHDKINLFHGECTEAAIMMCYKFQRIISIYLNFGEILGKKL